MGIAFRSTEMVFVSADFKGKEQILLVPIIISTNQNIPTNATDARRSLFHFRKPLKTGAFTLIQMDTYHIIM
jgi:hypothetical protein